MQNRDKREVKREVSGVRVLHRERLQELFLRGGRGGVIEQSAMKARRKGELCGLRRRRRRRKGGRGIALWFEVGEIHVRR